MDRILEIFIDAGIEIMEKIDSLNSSSVKQEITGMGADGTPTKYLDKVSEDIVLSAIYENDLPYNIVSEEVGFIDRHYENNLVIDPLDGTFNAEAGIPFYSLSVAGTGSTISDNKIAFVMDLANGDYFHSIPGTGAFHGRKKIMTSTDSRGYFSLSADYASDTITEKLLRRAKKIRTLGCASLELATLASGGLDMVAYIGRNNFIRNIDVAAGIAIVREAGGVVVDRDGNQFDMGLDVSKRKNILAFSSEKSKGEIL
ncbi:MAG: inositol monophosphatase family protein [Thermoplasmataceae archaeon]